MPTKYEEGEEVPVWWPGLRNSPTVTHACRKRRLKWVPSAWRYSWSTFSPGVINAETWCSRLGLGAGLTIQPRKKVIVKKSKKGRPGPDLGCRAIRWWWWRIYTIKLIKIILFHSVRKRSIREIGNSSFILRENLSNEHLLQMKSCWTLD
jgi:hypothetical protein